MIKGIIYRNRENDSFDPYETRVLDELLAEKFPDIEFVSVDTDDEFVEKFTKDAFKVIVFDWNSHPYPHYFIEKYFQSTHCACLVAIYHTTIQSREKALLNEYFIKEHVSVKERNKAVAYADLIKLVGQIIDSKEMAIKVRKAQLGIHYCINNNRLEKAAELFGKLKKVFSPEDLVFYESLLDKANRKYKSAILRIKNSQLTSLRLNHLLATLLFRVERYEMAKHYFELAHKSSSIHLRRSLLLAKCIDQSSAGDISKRKDAMGAYLATYKLCPAYSGVTGEIVSIIMDTESVENISIVTVLLDKLPHRALMRVYKKVDKFNEPFRTAFADSLVTAMSKIANRMIQEDDLTALTYYKYVGKLVPETDMKRRIVLDYCRARAYFRFGQLDMAQEICDKVVDESMGQYDKAVSLQKLIEKAQNGEFDVLLDDEKDWLIQKQSA